MQKPPSPFTFRRSIRLSGYDYRQAGIYFVTICAHRKSKIFGAVHDYEMVLSELGKVAHDQWVHVAKARPSIQLDNFVVMPNHLHGLIIIDDVHDRVASGCTPSSRD